MQRSEQILCAWLVCTHCNHHVSYFDRSIRVHCCCKNDSRQSIWLLLKSVARTQRMKQDNRTRRSTTCVSGASASRCKLIDDWYLNASWLDCDRTDWARRQHRTTRAIHAIHLSDRYDCHTLVDFRSQIAQNMHSICTCVAFSIARWIVWNPIWLGILLAMLCYTRRHICYRNASCLIASQLHTHCTRY